MLNNCRVTLLIKNTFIHMYMWITMLWELSVLHTAQCPWPLGLNPDHFDLIRSPKHLTIRLLYHAYKLYTFKLTSFEFTLWYRIVSSRLITVASWNNCWKCSVKKFILVPYWRWFAWNKWSQLKINNLLLFRYMMYVMY